LKANDLKGDSDPNKFASGRIGKDDLTVELPSAIFKGRSAEIKISFRNPSHIRLKEGKASVAFIINGIPCSVEFENGHATLNHVFDEPEVSILADDFVFREQIHFTNFWIFLLPAIALILIFIGIRYRKSKV